MSERKINRLLVANRGEIACRVMRTAKAMGIETVAVYSDADASAQHVKQADQALRIGPAPVTESYLAADRIIDAAKRAGVDAIHPGYGFLSENAGFAAKCAEAGLIFVGPTPDAIDIMGDKAKAKRRMIKAGVPCVPGYQDTDQTDAALTNAANKIGYPVLIKAAAGGGGRGMRLVDKESALAQAIATARSEARNAFGDDTLIIEKAIIGPRHVEIQVIADQHGNVVHLGERDCSVQRRYQKVLEEAPCPVMTPDLRAAMGDAAVNAARSINYVGAGTVEFLLDAAGAFYFLEMNTRLQVEHPVTELVTGIDLVEWQLRIAEGERLNRTQEKINLTVHAIEARLYAEDPANDFLPATGKIALWRPPSGECVRVDAGIETGDEVSPFYDPMIAKVIAYGADRDEARRRLVAALRETTLFGVTTNRGFLIEALEDKAFARGDATTAFLQSWKTQPRTPDSRVVAMAMLALFSEAYQTAARAALAPLGALTGWSSANRIVTPYRFEIGEEEIAATLTPFGDAYKGDINGAAVEISAVTIGHDAIDARIDGVRTSAAYRIADTRGASVFLNMLGADYRLTNLNTLLSEAAQSANAGAITAPMHGLLVDIAVATGDRVTPGQRLATLEAMKMQHELVAAADGTVRVVHAAVGAQVEANAIIIEIDPLSDGGDA